MLIFTQIEIMVIYIPIVIINVIHLELLGIPLKQVTTRQMLYLHKAQIPQTY